MSWMEKWTEIMRLRAAISACQRIIWLSSQLHHVELIKMASIADGFIPKLKRELEEVKKK